jgi:hypothetical protein
MATLTSTIPPVLSLSFTGASNQGQAAGWVAASGGGDLIPVSGRGTIFRVKTTGTGITVTINSVTPSNYGTDQDITMVLASTDEQEVLIKNDGRFDQGGANTGLAAVSYTAVTGVSIAAKIIPGSV